MTRLRAMFRRTSALAAIAFCVALLIAVPSAEAAGGNAPPQGKLTFPEHVQLGLQNDVVGTDLDQHEVDWLGARRGCDDAGGETALLMAERRACLDYDFGLLHLILVTTNNHASV